MQRFAHAQPNHLYLGLKYCRRWKVRIVLLRQRQRQAWLLGSIQVKIDGPYMHSVLYVYPVSIPLSIAQLCIRLACTLKAGGIKRRPKL